MAAKLFRRNHWVPVPEASNLTYLNRQLLAACHRDEGRWIIGRSQSIGAALLSSADWALNTREVFRQSALEAESDKHESAVPESPGFHRSYKGGIA